MTLNPMASSSASSPPPSRVDFLRRDPNANIVAGAVGGLFSLVVGHPFDTVKVRLQTMTLSGASVRPYTGSVDCAFKMVSVEGFRSLYRGMGGMVYLALPRFALIFHANALGKKIYRSIVGNKSHTPSKSSGIDIRETLFGGIFSQLAIVPLLVVPLERVKVLMQTRHKEVGSTGQIECMRRIVDRHGVVGLYKGVSLTYMRDIPSFCTYFLVYEVLRTKLMKRNPSESHVAHVFSTLVAGGLAGLSGWAVAIPMDVVKNRHQATIRPSSSIQTVASLFRSEGVRGFYRGGVVTLVRSVPANAATFLGYETALRLLAPCPVF